MGTIIGLCGRRGHGKDTAAAWLVANKGFVRVAFADALYAEVAEAFGVSVAFLGVRETKEVPQAALALSKCKDSGFVDLMQQEGFSLEQFLSPRVALQYWGTEYRRSTNDGYWRDIVEAHIRSSEGDFVITDVRYPDELEVVRKLGGSVYRVVAVKEVEEALASTDQHSSETALNGKDLPMLFNYWGNPNKLHEQVSLVV